MTATLEDYQRAVQGFVQDLRGLDGEVAGFMLHGSLAQGTVRPGQSDLLDAYLVVRQECLRDRERYGKALDVLASACGRLAATGLPFHHPPCWYGDEELGTMTSDAVFLPTLTAEGLGTILCGEDFRRRMDASAAGDVLSRATFFETRQRLCLPLARLASLTELPAADRRWLLARLERIQMVLPALAAAALGLRLDKGKIRAALAAALPEVDLGALDEIRAALRDGSLPGLADDCLLALADRTLECAEALHDGIVGALSSPQGQGPTAPSPPAPRDRRSGPASP